MTHSFQQRMDAWMHICFGEAVSADKVERRQRFLEEALELVQACGATTGEVLQLLDYVYCRPEGETLQEVGGVFLTLSALCSAHRIDMIEAGETELSRVWTKIDQIRAKQATKPHGSPLPGRTPEAREVHPRMTEDMEPVPAPSDHVVGPQDISTAPPMTDVLVWWPIVKLDEYGDPTDEIVGGCWIISEDQGGYWIEPDVMNAIGDHMGDDHTYADKPSHWMPLPAPLFSAASEGSTDE